MKPPAEHRKQDMRTMEQTTDRRHPGGRQGESCGARSAECEIGEGLCYPSNTFCGPIQGEMKTKSGKCESELRRDGGRWRLISQGRQSVIAHELGALYGVSRIEQAQLCEGERLREPKLLGSSAEIRAREDTRPPGQSIWRAQFRPPCGRRAPFQQTHNQESS